ncbi:MAG: response regulator [Desulfomonile tiedjei]|nr:response regulator [Desulfomonile tiedjei]
MKTHRILGLSVIFFVLICVGDAAFESFLFPEKPFLDFLVFDVSGHAIFHRSVVTLGFVIFGLIVSRAFSLHRAAEMALEQRTAKFAETNLLLEKEIAERKQAEEEGKQVKALLHSIVENLPTPVFLKDAEHLKYVLWNRASEDLYGYSSAEVVGKAAHEFFPSDQADRFQMQDREALRSGKLLSIPEQAVDTRRQGARVLHTKKLPILHEDGTPAYLLGISEDITERKQAEMALIQAREAAEQASRFKSEFLANMSHEIRTPINGIIGMTELALSTELTAEQQEYLDAVKISADSLLKLVNDILDFSKIEAGKMELIDVEFSLRDTVADVMTMLALQAHQKGLELVYDIPPSIPDSVIGDPGRIRQILVNLVGNAIKFTSAGEVVVGVQSVLEVQDDLHLHFVVADTGIGIPLEKRDRIFRAFEQADGSTSKQFGGTGLGLTITSQFCRMMGGNIWVESEVGKGSQFHFSVRLGLNAERVKRDISGDTSTLQGLPVIVVDDNGTNRKIVEQTLLHWGMKPTSVESGAAALTSMRKACDLGEPFRLAILDCMMPEMDGFELAQQINQDTRLAASAIVMLTSAGARGDACRCLELGVAAYLLKPVKQSELLFAISKVLQEPLVAASRPTLITRHTIRETESRLSILVAEDNAVNQKLAMKMLQRMGHTVTVAGNGREALELVQRANFDLILMDVQMPQMDGLEATAALREREALIGGHVPVIAMTAYAMTGDRERCLAAGMDEYISKPINARELYRAIEQVAQRLRKGAVPLSGSQPSAQVLDQARILDRTGGDPELLRKLVSGFVHDCPRLLSETREAFQQGDPERLEHAAHALKGAVASFAVESALKAASRLEALGRNRDLAPAPQAIVQLEREMERVTIELVALGKDTLN